MRNELLTALACLASGCPTAPAVDAGSPDASVIAPPGSGDAGTLVGTFLLLHLVNDGLSPTASLFGKVYDGPTPASLAWTLDTEDGDCRLVIPRVPFCATPCGGSAACVEDDVCQAFPTSRPLGTVHVAGVLTPSGDFDMAAINNGYQPSAGVTLAVPPFSDAQPITLTAEGSPLVQAFTLTAQGVAPLALSSTSLTLQTGAPLEVTWTGSSTARIAVKLDISHHGGTRGVINCETADDGALTISAALVTKLLALGVAGFPSMVMRRERVGSALITAGRVDLVVGSELEQFVGVPGLTSCTDTSQCPMGQTCQSDLRCN